MHSRPTKGLSVKEALEIILCCKSNQVCEKKPVSCQENALFVVSRKAVANIDDLKADDNGIWDWGGKPKSYHALTRDRKGNIRQIRPLKAIDDPVSATEKVFQLTRLYERHRGTREYHRILYYLKDSDGQDTSNVILQYYFDDGIVVPINVPAHGHRKSLKRPHYVVQKSTRDKVKGLSNTKAHKVIQTINSDVCHSRSASEEVRNRAQIYNARRSQSTPAGERKDALFELIEQCKQHHTQVDQGYVREVTFTKSPLCILTTHQQLQQMNRFCTGQEVFSVVGVDGTFNLGPFYVTVMTYTNLMVENVSTHKMPTLIGPIMVHMERTAEVYKHFFTQVVKYCPTLKNIRAVGTDGEQALVNALKEVFGEKCVYLRCFKHFKDDILRKLTSLGFPDSAKRVIINDIFGYSQGDLYIEGLLDSEEEKEFREKLEAVKDKWNELERSSCDRQHPNFHSWIMQYKADVAVSSMLASVRRAAGLGSCPLQYTQNRNESINRLLKDRTDYSKCSWSTLNDILYELVKNQEAEFERTITSSGEYQLLEQYRHLEVTRRVWNQWNEERRKAAIKCLRVCPLSRGSCISQHQGNSSVSLSVTYQDSGITTLPHSLLESMWNKASHFVNTPGQVLKAAGLPSNNRCVASTSGSPPHLVTKYPTGRLTCDSNCRMWKATRLCSHCLAAAEDMGCLHELLSWYVRSKQTVNITAVATDDLPAGVGKKPSDRRYSRKRTVQQAQTRVDPFSSSKHQQHMTGQPTATMATANLRTPIQCAIPTDIATPHDASTILQIPTTLTSQPTVTIATVNPRAPITGTFPASNLTSVLPSSNPTPVTLPTVNPRAPMAGTVPASNFTSASPSSNPAPITLPTVNPRGLIPSTVGSVSVRPSAMSTALAPQPTVITWPTVSPGAPIPCTTGTPSASISANVQLQLLQQLVAHSLQSSVSGNSQTLLGRTPAQPFQVTFITNKVKKCYGCNALFTDLERKSPNDLIICHPEFRVFRNNEGQLQVNHQLQNTYYHLRRACIELRYPNFQGSALSVPDTIVQQIVPSQRAALCSQFDLQL